MRLKKTLAIALACLLLPSVASGVSAATVATTKSDIKVEYNAKAIVFPDQKPVIKNSRTLVPIRPIAEGLGFKVDWNSKTQTVAINKATSTVNLIINQKTAKRNGQAISLDTPAQIINGRTMVPVRFIAEALNYQVNWNAAEQKVAISDQKLFASLGNVSMTTAEADRIFNAYSFVFINNKDLPEVLKDALRSKIANDALYSKFLMATHGSKITIPHASIENLFVQAKNVALKRHNNSQEAMKKEMAGLGITDQDIRDLLTYDLYTTSYVKSTITEQELLAYYKQHPELYTLASVRHILVTTEAEAKQVIARLAKGEQFAHLAKELSTDPGSKNNGGLYENALVSNWVKPFRNAAVEQPIGKVGNPVKTDFGYHVILVEKRAMAPYQSVQDDVLKEVVNDKRNALRAEALKNKK